MPDAEPVDRNVLCKAKVSTIKHLKNRRIGPPETQREFQISLTKPFGLPKIVKARVFRSGRHVNEKMAFIIHCAFPLKSEMDAFRALSMMKVQPDVKNAKHHCQVYIVRDGHYCSDGGVPRLGKRVREVMNDLGAVGVACVVSMLKWKHRTKFRMGKILNAVYRLVREARREGFQMRKHNWGIGNSLGGKSVSSCNQCWASSNEIKEKKKDSLVPPSSRKRDLIREAVYTAARKRLKLLYTNWTDQPSGIKMPLEAGRHDNLDSPMSADSEQVSHQVFACPEMLAKVHLKKKQVRKANKFCLGKMKAPKTLRGGKAPKGPTEKFSSIEELPIEEMVTINIVAQPLAESLNSENAQSNAEKSASDEALSCDTVPKSLFLSRNFNFSEGRTNKESSRSHGRHYRPLRPSFEFVSNGEDVRSIRIRDHQDHSRLPAFKYMRNLRTNSSGRSAKNAFGSTVVSYENLTSSVVLMSTREGPISLRFLQNKRTM